MYNICKMKNRTTIQIPKELRKALKEARKYKRETYEDTIKRLLGSNKKLKWA